jgi:glycogen(starch) synthase
LRLLFVGRLTEQKGVDLLLAIARELAKERPGAFELRIAGSGDSGITEQVRQLAASTDGVEYLGHIPNEDISAQYAWADATLIPSRFETLNKVAIETAAAGKVAVAADIPGPRAIIQQGVTGFLLPREQPAFMRCIDKLIEDKQHNPESLYEIGRAAYRRVREQFDPATALGELYDDIRTTVGRP